MKLKTILAISALSLSMAGCKNINYVNAVGSAQNLLQAATVSDKQLVAMSLQLRAKEDKTNAVAPANSQYAQRLQRIMNKLHSVNGIPLSYKVYMKKEVNANATPDGSVRVYSGLMDIMDDNELRFVLGHEIGHVACGHAKSRMRTAYATAAARKAIGIYSPAQVFSDSALGNIAESFVNAQYSQSNELEADAYGLQFLHQNGYPLRSALTCLNKLQGSGGFFSSHPSSRKRVEEITKRMQQLSARHH